MSFRPLYDNVLIKRKEAAEQTKSGLLLPKADQEKPQQATVIAIGPGKMGTDGDFKGMTVTTGDTVLFGKYHSGESIELEGEEHIIIKESDILAVVS